MDSQEILTAITIPAVEPRQAGEYYKLGVRKSMEISITGVASVVSLEEGSDTIADIKIALGAVAPTVKRATKAEDILRGEKPTAVVIEKAAEVAMGESSPISDLRASAEYRRAMVGVLTKRTIVRALGHLGVEV